MVEKLAFRMLDRLRRLVPGRETLLRNPLIRPFAPRVMSSELWRFTRRSVPRGVTLGILAGLIILVPGFQIFVAVLLCVFLRANIPVATAATFINTPLTTPPLIYACYLVGNALLGTENTHTSAMGRRMTDMNVHEWGNWFLHEAGPPVLLGLFIISFVTSTLGYVLSSWVWNWWVMRKRRGKLADRKQARSIGS